MKYFYHQINSKFLVLFYLLMFSATSFATPSLNSLKRQYHTPITAEVNDTIHNLFPATGYASIAFEDLWPIMGDYDLNDIVVDCKFDHITNAQNKVIQIQAQFILRAMGAAYHNGFGIELPVTPDKVASCVVKLGNGQPVPMSELVSIDSKGLEQQQSKAVVILFDDGYNVLPQLYPGIGVNTTPDVPWTEPQTINMTITFTEPIDPNLLVAPYNPFIFANKNRGNEIHLPNATPTSLADKKLFRTGDDDSNVSSFSSTAIRSYTTSKNLPWALFFYNRFDYPTEKTPILEAYLHFAEWAQSGGQIYPDWYINTASGYRVDSKIYLHAQSTSGLTVATTAISNIAATTATAGGNVTSDGGSAVTARGVCWSTTALPTTDNSKTTNGTGVGSFTINLTGLTPNTIYYVRAYATNSTGTVYGNQVTFTPSGNSSSSNSIVFNPNLNYGTVTDVEGNVYKTITIGTQTWMAENLRTTKFNDGTAISFFPDDSWWSTNRDTPAYCWANNDPATYKNSYGALYNWFAVTSGKLCPKGWHVPTDEEWTQLSDFLGGPDIAGSKLKETGTSHWLGKNEDATNASGFTAIPAPIRQYDMTKGSSDYLTNSENSFWWSSTWISKAVINNYELLWCRNISYYNSNLNRYTNFSINGLSVRCIKDAIPTLNTATTTNITATSASSGGTITNDYGSAITARGVCWSTSATPTISNSKTSDGSGTGSFVSNITGLTPNTTYHIRAYAINSAGTAYGVQQTFTTPKDYKGSNIDMVFVKGGTFQMGSKDFVSEAPVHAVTLSDYSIGKYVITQAQWKEIMGSNPSQFQGDNLPVEQVNSDDVQEFIKKLNNLTGRQYRLPTEAEYEFAAKGGTLSKGYTYVGGNTVSDVAWWAINSNGTTHEVGMKTPNELGIYDMCGNVLVWCSDYYGDYSSEPQTNPTGAYPNRFRVVRGSSWGDGNQDYFRPSFRVASDPTIRNNNIGLRLVLSN